MNPYVEDVHSQPTVLAEILRAYRGTLAPNLEAAVGLISGHKRLCLTGMGASLFACHPARALLDNYGQVLARVEETGYLSEHGATSRDEVVLLVSQSGETIEARQLLQDRPRNSPVILVTNRPDTGLAARADVVLPLGTAADHSVAVKTYTGSVALLLLLAEQLAGARGDHEPARIEDLFEQALADSQGALSAMRAQHDRAKPLEILGRGSSVSSALEAALLYKETAKRYAEGMSAGQFRHGAVEVMENGAPCLVFAPLGRCHELDLRLLDELDSYGASVIAITDDDTLPSSERRLVVRLPHLSEYWAPVVEIVPVQLLVASLAEDSGIRPGDFRNTVPVITAF